MKYMDGQWLQTHPLTIVISVVNR